MTADVKLTRNQRIVAETLGTAGQPLSAYQILDQDGVRAQGIKAPLTIYRALDKLIAHGLVHRIESLNAFVLCDHDHNDEPAAFMICEDCKQTVEVGTTEMRETVAKQAAKLGFKVAQIQIEVSGRCGKCCG